MESVAIVQAHLPQTEITLSLRFETWIPLPDLPVVTIRGLLGHALRAMLHPGLAGPEEAIPEDSAYWHIFKPSGQAPHPVLIDCEPGGGLARVLLVRLRFWGTGQQWYPICLDALEHGESAGFGPDRTPYRMEVARIEESAAPWQPDWPLPETGFGRVELLTPARLKEGGALVHPESDILSVIVYAAIRRLRGLCETHGSDFFLHRDRLHEALDRTQLTRMAFTLARDMRRSSRTGEHVSIGGIQGWFELVSTPGLLRLLQGAQYTAIGGKIAAGCGRVRLHLP